MAFVLCGWGCLTPACANPELLITDVSPFSPEYGEIYNPADQDVRLDGIWFFYYPSTRNAWSDPWRARPFPEDAVIRARGYFLVTRGDDKSGSDILSDWRAYSSHPMDRWVLVGSSGLPGSSEPFAANGR